MFDRASWIVRFTLLFTLLSIGCGRSSILDDVSLTDAGADAQLDARVDARPDGAPGCNATTCPTGCCAADGTCKPGDGLLQCGTFGATCRDCGAAGFDACDAKTHICVKSTPQGCTAASCPNGCCESGKCLGGSDADECGLFGETCQHCKQQGLACDDVSRSCVKPACGPGNCTGCCLGDLCLLGNEQNACGVAGQQCDNCQGRGQVCTPASPGGKCTVATCNASNCTGCCEGNTCRVGTEAARCGTQGQQCKSCTAIGDKCVPFSGQAGGFCSAGTTCSASNCSGCCSGNTCSPGTTSAQCGAAGNACRTCPNGQTCVNGACQTPQCGPQTCPTGCCNGNTCVAGNQNAACGLGGMACMACLTGATCVGNACVTQATCGPSNCAGCCVGNTCVNGTTNLECGIKGLACQACAAGTSCSNGICQVPPPVCGPANCNGCCDGNTCVGGTQTTACGKGGFACTACGSNQQCVSGVCQTTTTCGPLSCAGCCVNGVCAVGGQNTACGTGGVTCQNCTTNGRTCTNGTCAAQPCGPANCAGCCGANDQCLGGTGDDACGVGGQACTSCTTSGDVCKNQKCTPPPPPCGPTNCPGCCDAQGLCEGGFLDSSCGQDGLACTSCTQQGTTCDTSASPRKCSTSTTTCPAPYNACPASVSTSVPAVQHVCSSNDLQQARAACSGGANTTACQAYFAFEQAVNPTCATCLTPFDASFSEATALFKCVSPFVDAACNHDTGCVIDCTDKSCAQCSSGNVSQCRQDVGNQQCAQFFNDATCSFPAFFGAGAFCNPNNYSNFGGWLQGVGGHFCGP